MAAIYLVPQWFFFLGIFLEVLFAIVSALVACYAYRIYILSLERNSFLFSAGFALISVSYLLKALINGFLLSEAREGIRALNIDGLNMVGLIGTYSHILLFTTGLVIIAYMTFNIRSWRIFSLMLATNLLILVSSSDKAQAFNILSSLLLLYICIHYGLEYGKSKNGRTLLSFLAFIFLLFSGTGFIFAENYYLSFVAGHLMELAAYILILVGLGLIIRKKK